MLWIIYSRGKTRYNILYSPSMSEIDFETRCKASKSSVFNFQGYSNEILRDLRSSYFFTNLSGALHIKKYWYISCLKAAKFWQIYVARVFFNFSYFLVQGDGLRWHRSYRSWPGSSATHFFAKRTITTQTRSVPSQLCLSLIRLSYYGLPWSKWGKN